MANDVKITEGKEVLDLRHFSENPQNAQKQENQRTRLTKRLLRESLLELLRDKPVEHITVKELCELAELNRSTFYAYYNDVPALYQEMGGELARALLDHIRAINRGGGINTEPMLSYIRDNRELFRLLVYRDEYLNANQPVLRQIIEGYFGIAPELALPCAPEEREYFLQYLYMGGTGIIHRWVQNGCGLPPEQIAALIDGLIGRAVGA